MAKEENDRSITQKFHWLTPSQLWKQPGDSFLLLHKTSTRNEILRKKTAKNPTVVPSSGISFDQFDAMENHYAFYNVTVSSEAASTGKEAAKILLNIFISDKTDFCWEQVSLRSCISVEEGEPQGLNV